MILLLLMNACLALLFVLDKELLLYMPPMLFLASRTLLCGGLFAGYYLIKNWKNLSFSWFDILGPCSISFFNIYLANLFFFASLKTLSSAKASLIYNSKPFIVAVLAYFLLKDSISWKKALGLIVGWLGFIPIIFGGTDVNPIGWGISKGELLAFATAFAVSCSYIIYNKLMKRADSSVSLTSAVKLLFGGSLALITAYFIELNPESLSIIVVNTYTVSLFIAIVITTMAWALSFTYLTKKYPSAFLAATGLTTPIFSALFEWIFFNRLVSTNFFITLILVGIGLFIIYRAERHKLPAYKDVNIDD